MPKRSVDTFNPKGLRLAHSFYTDADLDRIIAETAQLPGGTVKHVKVKPDGSGLETVRLSRRAALAARLQSAAHTYLVYSEFEQKPTPAQLAKSMDRIETAADVLLTALGTPDGRIETMPAALRYGALEAFASIEVEQAEDLTAVNAGAGLLKDAVLGVEQLHRWAAQAKQLADDQGATPQDKRHAKDRVLIGFIDNLIDIYTVVFDRPQRTSVGAPDRLNEGHPGGPMIRFLRASLLPILGSKTPSKQALRARARETQKSTTGDF